MKAWVSHTAGAPSTLTLEDIPRPQPRTGHALVRVQAVGVNFPDSLLVRDLYQVRPPRPLIPGSEFCGVVEETADPNTHLRRGDVVVGVCGWGALAEYIAVPEDGLVRLPDGLPPTEAAAFLFTYATAYHALNDVGRLHPGESLLVLGAAGGVGSAAIDVATALGAQVFAAASTPAKLDFALSRGARAGLVYDAEPQAGEGQKALAKQLKELHPPGIDVVLDPVGGLYSEPALRALARGGRHLVVGFAAGIPRVPLNLTLLKQSHIIGVDWRMFIQDQREANDANVAALLTLWQHGLIEPGVVELVPFTAAPEAITRLESRQAVGKSVITVST